MAVEAPRIFLIAGEPSGDALGAGLIAAVHKAAPDAVCKGVGGPRMQGAGMHQVFPYDDLAVMGLVEVLPRYFRIRRRWRETLDAIRAFDPDVVVTIDSSGFNKPIARALAKEGSSARRVNYVAPMVWAWRPGRAQKMAALFHHLMVLFPFEPPYFTVHGLPTTYVGHPAIEAPHGDGPAFRKRHGIPPEAPLLCVLPGSRPGEVKRLLPVFAETICALTAEHADLVCVFPTLPLVADAVREQTAGLPAQCVVTEDPAEKADAFAAATAALAASGTITLELALAAVPMVVAYKVNPVTATIGRRVLNITSASLPNLLAGRQLVPECLQDNCTPAVLAAHLRPLLAGSAERAAQLDGFAGIRTVMTPPAASPSEAAAAIVLAEAAARRAAGSAPHTAKGESHG